MWKWIAVVTLSLLTLQTANQIRPSAMAKDLPEDVTQLRRWADDSMKRLKENDLHGVFLALAEIGTFGEAQIDSAVKQLTRNRDSVADHWGQPIGEVELVRSESIGKSFVRFIYLEKFQRHAMVWRVTFYRSGDNWRLSDLNWDSNPQTLTSLFKVNLVVPEETH